MRNLPTLLACAAMLIPPISIAAGPLPQAAFYYASQFSEPFSSLREVLRLGAICKKLSPDECGRTLERKAPTYERSLALADLVTVFGPEKRRFEASQFMRYEVTLPLLEAARDSMDRELLAYERDFLARYGAIAEVCPHKDLAPTLSTVSEVNFLRYWNLGPELYAVTLKLISNGTDIFARDIRAHWSKERCIETREFGRVLMAQLKYKLKPYVRDGWQRFTRDEHFGRDAGYIETVGIAFESVVDPQVTARAARLAGEGAPH
jgi:hypothetical protein